MNARRELFADEITPAVEMVLGFGDQTARHQVRNGKPFRLEFEPGNKPAMQFEQRKQLRNFQRCIPKMGAATGGKGSRRDYWRARRLWVTCPGQEQGRGIVTLSASIGERCRNSLGRKLNLATHRGAEVSEMRFLQAASCCPRWALMLWPSHPRQESDS